MSEENRNRANHRRSKIAAVLAAAGFVVAGLLAVAANAIAERGHAHKAKPSGNTVHVIEHAVTDTVVYTGTDKTNKTGNLLTFHNQVFDPSDTSAVGRDQGTCIRINPTDGSWECTWTTFLPGGQVTVEGPFYDTKNSVLAITGGTGAYSRARGQMELNARNRGTEFDFIFHLS
jgi:allene oxide cyclase